MSDAPGPAPSEPPILGRFVLRTSLLIASLALLFPNLLRGVANGAWPRLVDAMGAWRWAAWGACFVALAITRFSGGPRRGSRDPA